VSLSYHTEPKTKKRGKNKKKQNKKTDMFKVLINSPRKPWSQSCRRKGRLQCKGFAEKEGFKPGMKECGLIVIIVSINVCSITTV